MTQEQKQLLLKDLCARLPYHTKIDTGVHGISTLDSSWYELNRMNLEYDSDAFLPYLRPMSSMTKAEKAEYDSFNNKTAHRKVWINRIDWLLSKQFDIRGLIPMGLALEAHEGMYNI